MGSSPELLNDISQFHHLRLEEVRSQGVIALGEIAHREFDPDDGDLGNYLGRVTTEVGDVLDDTASKTTQAARETTSIFRDLASSQLGKAFVDVLDAATLSESERIIASQTPDIQAALRASRDQGVLEAAGRQEKLADSSRLIMRYGSMGARPALLLGVSGVFYQRACEPDSKHPSERVKIITAHPDPDTRAVLRSGLDSFVLDAALSASTPNIAVGIIASAGSGAARRDAMRIALNPNVQEWTLLAAGGRSALDSVRRYAVGDEEIRRMEVVVADKFLPKDEASLAAAQARAESARSDLREFDGLGFWQRVLPTRRKQREPLIVRVVNTEAQVNALRASVEELRSILNRSQHTEST